MLFNPENLPSSDSCLRNYLDITRLQENIKYFLRIKIGLFVCVTGQSGGTLYMYR